MILRPGEPHKMAIIALPEYVLRELSGAMVAGAAALLEEIDRNTDSPDLPAMKRSLKILLNLSNDILHTRSLKDIGMETMLKQLTVDILSEADGNEP